MQIFIGFVDAILRSKILRNRLGILTQIFIAINYFFYLHISDKYINLGNQFHYKEYNERDRNIIKKFVFIFYHSNQHETSSYTFYKEKKAFAREHFGSPHKSNWIYLLQNCFSNYVYLKDMYITLKGIGKILFVSVSRILLMGKFQNFTTTFNKKNLNFPKFSFNFPHEKVNFSLIYRTHITIQSYILKKAVKIATIRYF